MRALGRVFTYVTLLLCVALSGCTSRGLTVTSEPPGAEVSINRRVVGKTPIRVTFNHYGTYRIELRKDGYKVMVKEEPVRPPIYGYDPVAVVADNVIPARLNDEVYLHYALKSLELKDDKDSLSERESLLDRAFAARNGTVTHPQTGEIVQIKLDRIPPATPGEAIAANAEDEDIIAPKKNTPTVASGETPLIAPPSDTIQDTPSLAKPKEASLAKELGIDVPAPAVASPRSETRGTFVSPEAAKPERPRVVRTPKDELLIYQAPKIEKKDEDKKTDDVQKPEPAGPRPPEAKKTAAN